MKCPHCEWPLDYTEINTWFVAHDYSTEFDHACPSCQIPLAVRVHPVPEFEVLNPEPPPEPA